MSYNELFNSLSPVRQDFVGKIYNEMDNNATTNASDREDEKKKFLQLVEKNKEISEKEKEYCREYFIYLFENQNALHKLGKPLECKKCNSTRYSDRYCEECISQHLQSLFSTWTSGNEIIDNFIQKCQRISSLPTFILEWIPFEQFYDVTKLTEGGFSSIYSATWTKGPIIDYNENKKEFIYFNNLAIVLKSLNNSSNPGKSFFDEVINVINHCCLK